MKKVTEKKVASKKTTAKKTTAKKAAAKAPAVKRTGIIALIDAAFAGGAHTVDEVVKQLNKKKVEFSLSTVRTQVGKLRKDSGFSTGRTEGPIAKINELFAAGNQTVPEIMTVLEKEKVEVSPATVRTQVGKLRREANLTGKKAPAQKAPAKKKKTTTAKKVAVAQSAKKTTKKKTGGKTTG